jgi:C4-dicarboxylate-specific signal transduction histidine kinase
LAASIAHEVNQPLAALVTGAHACARWLAANPPNPREVERTIASLVRNANRAADIIRRIRTFVTRGSPAWTAIDLGATVAEVAALVQGELRGRNVSLELSNEAVPRARADRIQIQQVILTLMMNAVDAMEPVPRHRRTLSIGVAQHDAETLRVSVRDGGVGIAPTERDRLFEAFHTTKPDGMGMGLTISRSIVEAHGGHLWATPNDDYGETFHFTLPTAPA